MSQVEEEVERKRQEYCEGQFPGFQPWILATIFDLIREYEDVKKIHELFEFLLKKFLGVDARLYLLNESGKFSRASKIFSGNLQDIPAEDIRLCKRFSIISEDGCFLVPIRCSRLFLLEFSQPVHNGVLGVLEVQKGTDLSEPEKLFLEKIAAQIGYQVHKKITAQRNKDHLAFIHGLIADIGHNVIVPNMYLKLLFRNMGRKLDHLESRIYELKLALQEITSQDPQQEKLYPDLFLPLKYDFDSVVEQQADNYSTFMQISLFLETLLRKSHFEKGQYVLVKRPCNFKVQVIDPQMNSYRPRFQEKGIEIDMSMGGVPDEEVVLKVDVGLLSQVFSNLFSNAVKYAQPVRDNTGTMKKFVAYGWEWIRRGPEKKIVALKLNVFTSGPHINEEDRSHLFEPDFRANNTGHEIGTGRGLFFVKQIIELHGGAVGYRPAPLGNDFYIILPYDDEEED